MPINFNNIQLGGRKEQGSSSGGQEPEKRGIQFNLLGGRNAQKRMNEAAEAQRQADLKAQEEQQRQVKLGQARTQIQEIVGQGPDRPVGVPGIDRGLPDRIRRIALTDPDKAYQKALKYIADVRAYNDRIDAESEANEVQRQNAEIKLQELKEKPQRVWGYREEIPEDVSGFKRFMRGTKIAFQGGLNLVGHGILSTINGTPQNGLDQIEVSDEGLTIFSPFSRSRRKTFDRQTVKKDLIISDDPPKLVDKALGILSNLPIIGDKIEKAGSPIGRITVTYGPGNIDLTAPVTLWPKRRKEELEKLLKESTIPDSTLPKYEPVPDPATLLGPAAKELGLIPEEKPTNSSIDIEPTS